MDFFKSTFIVVVSSLLSLFAAEGLLRLDGRYQVQASAAGSVTNSNKIWTRGENTSYASKHPDLGYKIEVQFDKFGSRESKYSSRESEFNVGVFGDSFVENRRILNEFTFTEMLNSLSSDTQFWNFGIDGYGLEQNFQHWLDKSPLIDLDTVIYVFCANDLTDTYFTQLFDRSAMKEGRVANIVSTEIPVLVRLASRLHLTYLMIQSYYHFKSLEVPMVEFPQRLGGKFTKTRMDMDSRMLGSYASDMQYRVLLNESSKEDAKTTSHFAAVLKTWSKLVKEKNGRFVILILPTEIEKILSTKIIPSELEVIQLTARDQFLSSQGRGWRFENDGHWNEYGNLSAARELAINLDKDHCHRTNCDLKVIDETLFQYLQKIDETYSSEETFFEVR